MSSIAEVIKQNIIFVFVRYCMEIECNRSKFKMNSWSDTPALINKQIPRLYLRCFVACQQRASCNIPLPVQLSPPQALLPVPRFWPEKKKMQTQWSKTNSVLKHCVFQTVTWKWRRSQFLCFKKLDAQIHKQSPLCSFHYHPLKTENAITSALRLPAVVSRPQNCENFAMY